MQLLKEGGREGDFSPEADMCCNLRICVVSNIAPVEPHVSSNGS